MRRSVLFLQALLLAHVACDDASDPGTDAADGAVTDGPAGDRSPLEVLVAEAPFVDVANDALGDASSSDGPPPSDTAMDVGSCGSACTTPSMGLGYGRTCLVKGDGTARCWGRSAAASLLPPGLYRTVLPFDLDTTIALTLGGRVVYAGGRDQPVPRDDVLVSLVSSPTLSCGLRPDRSISCWGPRSVTVPPTGPFAEVSVGEGTACGRRDDGTVTCWPPFGPMPMATPPGPFKQVRNSNVIACGIRMDDSVQCWGRDPAPTTPVPPGKFVKLDVAGPRVCGLKQDGTILCWYPQSWPATPVAPIAGSFRDMFFRAGQGCGVRDDGGFACWGTNVYGEATLPDDDRITKLGGACMLTAQGQLRCWGEVYDAPTMLPDGPFVDVDGYLGGGCALTADGAARCWVVNSLAGPFEAPANHRYSQVQVVLSRGCGILRDSQQVECWPPPPAAQAPPAGTFTSFALGTDGGCGIRTDGAIQCWGRPAVGFTPPTGSWKQLDLVGEEGCALSTAGEISCWGDPRFLPKPPPGPYLEVAYQAGWVGLRADGTLQGLSAASTDTYPAGRFVDLSGQIPCALADTGAVRCWGSSYR